jgi:hypothetical protein
MSDSTEKTCMACQGSGKCSKCMGAGNVTQTSPTPIAVVSGQVRGSARSSRTCNRCYGSGVCQVCKGTKKAP